MCVCVYVCVCVFVCVNIYIYIYIESLCKGKIRTIFLKFNQFINGK